MENLPVWPASASSEKMQPFKTDALNRVVEKYITSIVEESLYHVETTNKDHVMGSVVFNLT
jgi:hypothetical protein